ncbi:MAG TPA: PHB depolymerase family esterase [Dyella sp.]|uniref:alpha/beta hydrolase family esterase n=1 Tax=Dyella sp. TaxID=1869338 RepID=UPI002C19F67F|nr:PHB depolymerase family esterase [Dyella sp.]HTV85419.1 PHB depolymerase family esterase [Dyella sp.]
MKKVLRVTAAVIAALAIVCFAAVAYWLYSPTPKAPRLGSAVTRETIDVHGMTRSFLTYVPLQLPAGAPLVIVLHGSMMNGAMMRKWTGYEFDRLADKDKFVVLYPDGYKGNWNDCRADASYPAKTEHIDDVSFIEAMIARMRTQQGIDPRRVYMFGYSNGGHMGFRMAMEHADDVAAVAAVAASLPVQADSSCPASGPTSRIMLIDGTDDPINPFSGGMVSLFGLGKRGRSMSALASAELIAQRNHVADPPTYTQLMPVQLDDPTRVGRSVWYQAGIPMVELDAVYGGGHVIPQPYYSYPRLLGRTSSAIDAPKAAVAFFGLK